nr:acetate--CoA ligase family protein [Acidobacteriota bacterium]
MKIHEFQAKAILSTYGVPVPRGKSATTAAEAKAIAQELGGGLSVVKAQIHAGGRGKGGGVKVAKTPDDAFTLAGQILGMTLVTHQTGPEGKLVSRVLVEEGLQMTRELYLGIVLDRSTQRPVVMVSPDGGMEIEKVAAETPERIFKAFADPALGLQPYQARQLAFALGLQGAEVGKAVKMMMALYKAYIATDASLLEINPLVVTAAGDPLALDAKMAFDDNAMFRHPDFVELRDLSEEDPLEVEASKYQLN